MIRRILVAVDDSTPAIGASRFAIELAGALRAELGVVAVAEPRHDPGSILRHVAALADAAGVSPTITAIREGDLPFEAVLAEVRTRDADLVGMRRSDERPTGRPYVGSQTEHLLESTDVPVVVPGRARGRRS